MMLSDVCLSVACTRPKLRTERPRKTKFDAEIAHATRDTDITFNVKRSRSPGRFAHHVRRLQLWAWVRVGCGKLLLRCHLLGDARRFGAHRGGEGWGILWQPPAYSFLVVGRASGRVDRM